VEFKVTCNEGVFDAEAEAFQLLITGELDPHETSCGSDQAWILSPTETIDKRREPKWTIAYFNVIKAALERRLDVVILIKSQLNPLSWKGFGKQGREGKQREKIIYNDRIKSWLAGQR